MKYLVILLLLVVLGSCNSDKRKFVELETDFGTMKIVLYDETPVHRDNFVKLVEEGFYDDLLFHRVMKDFMIQGGDPDSRTAERGQGLGTGGPGYTLEAEIGAPHLYGTLAAARTGGPSNPDKRSSGSQFYIVQGHKYTDVALGTLEIQKNIKYNDAQRAIYIDRGGTAELDMEYTVFGEVVEGFEVIDKIALVQTDGRNRPVQDVRMKIRVIK
jgi:cyclophilin family peptidyl-prolyl cis-trans isomerase